MLTFLPFRHFHASPFHHFAIRISRHQHIAVNQQSRSQRKEVSRTETAAPARPGTVSQSDHTATQRPSPSQVSAERGYPPEPDRTHRHARTLQLVHACQAYRYLQEMASVPDTPGNRVSEQILHGVRLVIFVCFTDLVDAGAAPTGRLILANTLDRPAPPQAQREPAGDGQQ
jgi:hypothetical protein